MMANAAPNSIIVTETELLLQNARGELQWRIFWSDVKEIAAWKDDVFSYDTICLGFRTTDKLDYFWCDEEGEGWKAPTAFLKTKFGVEWDAWFDKVAFPAFQKNFATLWGTPIPRPHPI